MEIRVYTTKLCSDCKTVKEFLAAEGEAFEEVDITMAEALTELRMNGVFTLVAPVLQIGSVFVSHTDLFTNGALRKERIRELIKPLQGVQVAPSGNPFQGFGDADGAHDVGARAEPVMGQTPTRERRKHEKDL